MKAPNKGSTAPYANERNDLMFEFIGLVVCVIIVSIVIDTWLADESDITIKVNGKEVFRYSKEDESKKKDKNKQ